MNDSDKFAEEALSSGKAYSSPQLVHYGRVRELTTSGSVNKNENGGHPSGMG